MHLALGSDVLDSCVRYQTRLIREYNRRHIAAHLAGSPAPSPHAVEASGPRGRLRR